MSKKILTIIPAAGRGSRMLSLTDNCAKSMVPIASKPLISYLLDQLVEQNLMDVAIIVGYKKETIIDYVTTFYNDKLNIIFVEQKELLGLGHALYETVKQINVKNYDGIFIMLGDAIFNTNAIYDFEKSYIACKIMPDYSRWCIAIQENNKLIKFLDKPNIKPEINLAVIGAYYFDNSFIFDSCVLEAIQSGITIKNEYQISTIIELYNKLEQVYTKIFNGDNDWFDFGELDTYNTNRKKIYQCRYFNSIYYDDDLVHKTSDSNKQKIQREIFWYLALPNKLKKFTPRLVSYNLDDTNPSYSMEYCNGTTLQELWLYSNFKDEMWIKIIDNVISIINSFKDLSNKNTIDFYSFIKNQLKSRVDIDEFFSGGVIEINKNSYNLVELKEFFNNYLLECKDRFENVDANICHGDMVFSNIIYDISTDNIKLIDPRGNFCGNILYGDVRYDIAKLTQCIIGDYDYIVNDLCVLSKNGYKIFLNKNNKLKEYLFDYITNGFNKNDIMFLTAIQFMTMIKLHSENIKHQIIMRYKAIELLSLLKENI